MRLGATVLARLSSSRLPGKVLRDVGGRPLIAHVLARVEQVRGLDEIVVATSADAADDALEAWCGKHGVPVFRGDLVDVRGRVIACAEHHGLDAVARVNADSPWLDPALLAQGVARMRATHCDLVTNVLERTYPYGVAVEVVSVAALLRSRELLGTVEDAEHVTRAIY